MTNSFLKNIFQLNGKNSFQIYMEELKFIEGKGGNNSLMTLKVECVKCKEGYTLGEAFTNIGESDVLKNEDEKEKLWKGRIKYSCTGNRPWLGQNSHEKNCEKKTNCCFETCV